MTPMTTTTHTRLAAAADLHVAMRGGIALSVGAAHGRLRTVRNRTVVTLRETVEEAQAAVMPCGSASSRVVPEPDSSYRDENPQPPTVTPPIAADPSEHRVQRSPLQSAFTHLAINSLEPRTRTICRELLERFSDRNTCDGAVDYAQEIPARVMAHMLGISEDSCDLFRQWIHDFMEVGMTDPGTVTRVITDMTAYLAKEIAKRRASPRSDLISCLLDARMEGQALTDDHIIGTLRPLLIAGVDTTWSAIGSCLWHLATHADDRRRLVAEPQLIPPAVEEFLRAYAPATMAREVIAETEINGCRFKVGEMVMLAFAAANHDHAVFPDADRVMMDRAENRQAAFGPGIHRRIGSDLARMAIRVALEEWLKQIPEFSLAPEAVVGWSTGTVRGPRRLPFVLG